MTVTLKLARRTFLATGAAAIATPALAKAPMMGAATPVYSRFTLGKFEVTTLLGGARMAEDPQGTFGMNVDAQTFNDWSAENFVPADSTAFYFTPTLVNTGDALVLFDTGLGNEALGQAMAAAGYSPDQVDTVVITHMHPDHIGGLMGDGSAFPNASYVTGATEYDFWSKMDAGNRVGDMVASKVVPLAEKMAFVNDGDSPMSGITAMDASGHTPGHMAWMVESDGQSVLLAADLANHYVWSLARPDWEVRFDMDKQKAAAARKRILGMLAADKTPMIGYHMPFPALGYVEATDSGFRWVPETYQLSL